VIRPITGVCFLMACGAGLYLYQAKHRVSMLDQQIEKTVRGTEAVREQIRLLHAEWTRLSQPDRLQNLADQFLKLKTTSPSQFTSMAELDARLPPVPPPQTQPPPPQREAVPSASAQPPAPSQPASVPAGALPSAPAAVPAAPSAMVATATPPAHHDASPHQPADEVKAVARSASVGSDSPALHRPLPIARPRPPVIEAADRSSSPPRGLAAIPAVAPPPPVTGSLLGMAHAAPALPAPRPVFTPVGPNGN
jgi:hypothetical protein